MSNNNYKSSINYINNLPQVIKIEDSFSKNKHTICYVTIKGYIDTDKKIIGEIKLKTRDWASTEFDSLAHAIKDGDISMYRPMRREHVKDSYRIGKEKSANIAKSAIGGYAGNKFSIKHFETDAKESILLKSKFCV